MRKNFQREFLCVTSVVILSIYVRSKVLQSQKPVDSPHMATGK
ncbi:DUF6766 family protein [Sphingobacterium nematocida]